MKVSQSLGIVICLAGVMPSIEVQAGPISRLRDNEPNQNGIAYASEGQVPRIAYAQNAASAVAAATVSQLPTQGQFRVDPLPQVGATLPVPLQPAEIEANLLDMRSRFGDQTLIRLQNAQAFVATIPSPPLLFQAPAAIAPAPQAPVMLLSPPAPSKRGFGGLVRKLFHCTPKPACR
jgi:hypothetical protein